MVGTSILPQTRTVAGTDLVPCVSPRVDAPRSLRRHNLSHVRLHEVASCLKGPVGKRVRIEVRLWPGREGGADGYIEGLHEAVDVVEPRMIPLTTRGGRNARAATVRAVSEMLSAGTSRARL